MAETQQDDNGIQPKEPTPPPSPKPAQAPAPKKTLTQGDKVKLAARVQPVLAPALESTAVVISWPFFLPEAHRVARHVYYEIRRNAMYDDDYDEVPGYTAAADNV